MLQKIIHIKGVGRFKNCVATGDVTLRRFTLVFAENGGGKTTLCAILRSLLRNSPALILGRKTLGSSERPDVHLMLDGAPVLFRNGAWSVTSPDIAIFDATYVIENVFAGDVVDTEHRRNLYRVIVGAEGVALATRVNELDNEIRAKNNEIRDCRAGLQQYLPSGMTVDAFVELPRDLAIDAKIAAKEQELQAAQRAAQLLQRAALVPITVPTFPPAFAELLAKTFALVSESTESRIAQHVLQHRMANRGESWLTEGLQLARVGEENTTIAEWDIERAVQARYRADIEVLHKFFSLREGDARDVIQKIRPVLEGYCRALYPTEFLETDLMGVIVGKIRAAGTSHRLYEIADDLDEINIYCRRYHHGENPNAATEPIDDSELQGYIRRTLLIAGCLP
jgi:hypothetical protein